MITRVSTSTEGYDPYRKGRRVVTIDKRHMELIGGTVRYAPISASDGTYNNVEIVGGEAWDAFKAFLCKLTGWCGHAATDAASTAKDTVVKMLPEENGEEPGNTLPPDFEDARVPAGGASSAGMPFSSAPEDYAGPQSPSGYPAQPPPPPPPLPAASLPIMQKVVARLQQGDPVALKSISQLAGQASTNPIAAQTLKNIAALSFKPAPAPSAPAPYVAPSMATRTLSSIPSVTTSFVAPAPTAISSRALPLSSISQISFQPAVAPSGAMGAYRPTTRTIAAGATVGNAIGDIFKLVLSPLAWTLDGTGRLTAIAGQKLEHLSRLI